MKKQEGKGSSIRYLYLILIYFILNRAEKKTSKRWQNTQREKFESNYLFICIWFGDVWLCVQRSCALLVHPLNLNEQIVIITVIHCNGMCLYGFADVHHRHTTPLSSIYVSLSPSRFYYCYFLLCALHT